MTAPETAAIRGLKSKRSKCADVGNIDLSNVPESHETIWLQWGGNGDTWCADNIYDEDVPYIRADLVFALCDEVDRLRAENERLRKALKGMDLEAQRETVEALLKPTLIHLVMKMSDDARAALAQKGGE